MKFIKSRIFKKFFPLRSGIIAVCLAQIPVYCFIDFQPNDNDAVYYFTVKIAFAISLTMKGVYHAFF